MGSVKTHEKQVFRPELYPTAHILPGFLQMLPILSHRQLHLEEIQTNPQISSDLGFFLLPVYEDGGQNMEHVTQRGKAAVCSIWADLKCSDS